MFVALEGPIGVGKSSLCEILANDLNARFFADPAENAVRLFDEKSMDPLAVETEILALRLAQLKEIKKARSSGKSVVADWDLCKLDFFGHARLNQKDHQLLNSLNVLVRQTSSRPDLLVFVTSDAATIQQRIKLRGRLFEQSMEPTHIQEMIDAFQRIAREIASTPGISVISFENRNGIRESANALTGAIRRQNAVRNRLSDFGLVRALTPNA